MSAIHPTTEANERPVRCSEQSVEDVLSTFLLRLSQARSISDIQTAAGIAEQEMAERSR